MIDFGKLIKKNYPAYDENRHYWFEGDYVVFNDDCEALCIGTGLESAEFIITKGFSKGTVQRIPIERTPYVKRTDFDEAVNIALIESRALPDTVIRHKPGDIFVTDSRMLVCVKSIDEKGWMTAYVVKDYEPKRQCYNQTCICFPEKYDDYIMR